MTCNQREGASYVKVGHCAYHDICTNETVAAYCPYVFPLHLVKNELIHLPQNLTDLNNFTCSHVEREVGDERSRNGTGPSVHSMCYMSLDKYSLTMYIMMQYVPITLISLVVIIIFRISMVSPPLGHYIMYCNIVQLVYKSCVGSTVKPLSLAC